MHSTRRLATRVGLFRPTVMGGLVYFSTLEGKTYAVDAGTGKRAWTFPDGEYPPLVTDGRRAYIVGLARVYALEPKAQRRARKGRVDETGTTP